MLGRSGCVHADVLLASLPQDVPSLTDLGPAQTGSLGLRSMTDQTDQTDQSADDTQRMMSITLGSPDFQQQ